MFSFHAEVSDYRLYMQCTNPINLGRNSYPCGKCLSCRIAKSREWSLRLMDELGYWKKSVFVTLTYDEEHLPKDHSLHKSELQKFFKRLRKMYGEKIRYYACGEYGSKIRKWYDIFNRGEALGRPHYHAIIFGLGNDEFSKYCVKSCWKYCNWKMLQDSKCFGSVTRDSCRYVSDYIFKKYDKIKAQKTYGAREIPFKIQSNGLGLRFCMDNAENLIHNGFSTYNGVKVSLPRYYRLKLGIKSDPMEQFINTLYEAQKWKNYCRLYKKPMDFGSIVALKKSMRLAQQEKLERNAQLHNKGDL